MTVQVNPESKLKEFENEVREKLGKYFYIETPKGTENIKIVDDTYQIIFKFKVKPEYKKILKYPDDSFYICFRNNFIRRLYIYFPKVDDFLYVSLYMTSDGRNKEVYLHEDVLEELNLMIYNKSFDEKRRVSLLNYMVSLRYIQLENMRYYKKIITLDGKEDFLEFNDKYFEYIQKKRKLLIANTIPFLLYFGEITFNISGCLYELTEINDNLIVVPRDGIGKIAKNLENTKKILKEKFGYNVASVVSLSYNNRSKVVFYKGKEMKGNFYGLYNLLIEIENENEREFYDRIFNEIKYEDFIKCQYRNEDECKSNCDKKLYKLIISFSKLVRIIKNTKFKNEKQKRMYLKLYYIFKYVFYDFLFMYATIYDYVFGNCYDSDVNYLKIERLIKLQDVFLNYFKKYKQNDIIIYDNKEMKLKDFLNNITGVDSLIYLDGFVVKALSVIIGVDYYSYFSEILEKINNNKFLSLSEIVLLLKIKPEEFKRYITSGTKHYEMFPICIEKGKLNIEGINLYIFDIKVCKKSFWFLIISFENK